MLHRRQVPPETSDIEPACITLTPKVPESVKKPLIVVDEVIKIKNAWDESNELLHQFLGDDLAMTLDETIMNSVVGLVGDVAMSIFPALFEMSETIPFVGVAAKAATMLFHSIKQSLNNFNEIKNLSSVVMECMIWLKQNEKSLRYLMSNEEYPQFTSKVKDLTHAICKANGIVVEWNTSGITAELIKNIVIPDKLKSDVDDIILSIDNAKEGISFESTTITLGMTLTQQKEENLCASFKGYSLSFDVDITMNCEKFIPGTRSWMHTVS